MSVTTGFRCTVDKTEDSLRKLRALDYTCGLGVMIRGLGLYSYFVREFLVSLVLFSAVFFLDGPGRPECVSCVVYD